MNRILVYVKEWWAAMQARALYQRSKEIQRSFSLEERDGAIWIMADGKAIRRFQANNTQMEIIQALNEHRLTALCYERKCDSRYND